MFFDPSLSTIYTDFLSLQMFTSYTLFHRNKVEHLRCNGIVIKVTENTKSLFSILPVQTPSGFRENLQHILADAMFNLLFIRFLSASFRSFTTRYIQTLTSRNALINILRQMVCHT